MEGAGAEADAEAASASFLWTVVFVLLSLLWLFITCFRPGRSKLCLPPSPPRLPLLGHIHLVKKATKGPFLQHLRETMGPIFSLQVGKAPLIYITSAALAHEALVEKSLIFAYRPRFPSRALFSNNYRNINAASYGRLWRGLRRNLVHEMLAMPKILSFKPARVMVLDRLIDRIIKESSRSDGVISFFSCIRTAMFELLLFMCFGFDLSKDSQLQIVEIVDAILHLPSRAMQDFYPFTSIFFRGQERRVSELRSRQIKVYSSLIEEHKERCAHGTISPGSYLETLLHLDTGMPFSTVDLVTLCSEFIVAGTDTTVTTLEWAMARLADDASIQGKLLDEIKAVVGDRPVEETDLQKLPYLQAIVRETLRLHPPGHFLLPHAVSEACKIGGYDIPANAVVLFHVIAMGRDPQHWEKPLEFKPDRFLNKEFDVTGTKQSAMLPFGAGRRICPGLGLATMHLELFIARLVQKLNWTPYPKGERVDFDEKMVFTVRMKNPLKVLVEQRNT